MAKTTPARPADMPVRASDSDDDNELDPDVAEARKRAGIALRKMTVASTMVYAGLGARASERAKTAAARKQAARKPTAAKRPPAKPKAISLATATPESMPVETSPASAAAADVAPAPRKRLRSHSQFILRIADTIAGQLDAIDAITRDPNRGETGPSEAERHARTVAALARVSAELRKEQEAERRRRADDDDSARDASRSTDPHRPRDPDRPRDLDDLRERLSRRLDIRLRSGSDVSVGDDAAGGNRLPE